MKCFYILSVNISVQLPVNNRCNVLCGMTWMELFLKLFEPQLCPRQHGNQHFCMSRSKQALINVLNSINCRINDCDDDSSYILHCYLTGTFALFPACNVLYINSVEMESLTGPQAIAKAISETLAATSPPTATVVHFKVSSQGITLTDNQRK